MDHLWSPWRYRYVTGAGNPRDVCIFCQKHADNRDAENYIVYRGALNYVMLNLFPYTNGHVMIAPYEHVPTLAETRQDMAAEMMALTRQTDRILREVYNARGVNLGMNLGECAGAGVAGHIHMHVLPRWPGDVNFMTVVAETRVLPEELPVTFEKLKRAYDALGRAA
jgi:ATP adenylyltransferase